MSPLCVALWVWAVVAVPDLEDVLQVRNAHGAVKRQGILLQFLQRSEEPVRSKGDCVMGGGKGGGGAGAPCDKCMTSALMCPALQ